MTTFPNRTSLWLALAVAGCSAPPMTSPPTVVSTSPADKATNVARETAISATFSEAMVANSIAATTLKISPAVPGSVSLSGSTATLTHSEPLAYATVYTVTVTTGARGEQGGPLAADVTWSFTTVDVNPVVSSTVPVDGALGIGVGTTVTATFSRPMNPATITSATFTLSPSVAGVVSYGGTTATFTPSAPLAFGTAYTATITADAKDAAGVPLGAARSWTFTTGIDPPPTVGTFFYVPPPGPDGVKINSTINVTFSMAMKPESINATSFTVATQGGGIAGGVTYDAATKTATFKPDSLLAYEEPYVATVTTAVQNANGTHLATNYGWQFAAEPQPPGAVANAGPTQDVNTLSTVTLDGTRSTGTGTLTYVWTPVAGATTALSGAKPTFTAPADVGTVLYDLVVTDQAIPTPTTSGPSRVQINVMKDRTKALFVSTAGNDSSAGTRDAPLRTIQRGINLAATTGAGVYVASGVYAEGLALATDVSVFGGFDRLTWIRNLSGAATQVSGPSTAISANRVVRVTVDGLTVVSASATIAGTSSYGFLVALSEVTLSHNHIRTGNGANGANGVPGTTGSNGQNGSRGDDGTDSPPSPVTAVGGRGGGLGTLTAGGSGGNGLFNADGLPGFRGAGPSAGDGGAGGTRIQGSISGAGGRGSDATAAGPAGNPGVPAADGTGGSSETGYVPADGGAGTAGGPGSGGGGGGAGGGMCYNPFCDGKSTGNAGGGGGQGGAGGTGGGGGKGGGGSFGIYSYHSQLAQTNNDFIIGSEGAGGLGGAGGGGGTGGAGGAGGASPSVYLGSAGSGGRGSAGGRGGDGGKGAAGGHMEVADIK